MPHAESTKTKFNTMPLLSKHTLQIEITEVTDFKLTQTRTKPVSILVRAITTISNNQSKEVVQLPANEALELYRELGKNLKEFMTIDGE